MHVQARAPAFFDLQATGIGQHQSTQNNHSTANSVSAYMRW